MKKLNESVYRSPKWLQKFADFELRTGKDIKGGPSEKEKEIIRKKQEEENRVRQERENQYRRERERYESEKRIREEDQRKRNDQQRLDKELNDLFNLLMNDFKYNPYDDKYDTVSNNGKITFKYRFENGQTFEMFDNSIVYIDNKYKHGYKVGLTWRNKFVGLCNNIINSGKSRPSQNYNNQNKSTYKESPKSGNPQKDKYNLINDKIKLREEQLKGMSKTDTNRQGLENELRAYKRVRDKMKAEYKFEGLKYLKMFESKRWTLDELVDAMKHPFLDKKFITEIFSDLEDLGYSLGFKGHYTHDWLFTDGYNTISDEKDIHKRFKLKGFELAFYKDLDEESGDFRPISKIKNELTGFENSVTQYLNQPEFDDDYEFLGIHIEIDGDPKALNLQKVSLKFINKSTEQSSFSSIYVQD